MLPGGPRGMWLCSTSSSGGGGRWDNEKGKEKGLKRALKALKPFTNMIFIFRKTLC